MPIAAIAPALISTVGGSLLGHFFGGPSDAQKDSNSALQTLASNTGQAGLNFTNQAQGALGQAQGYQSSLLNGNLGQASSALAPDIDRIRTAAAQQLNNTTNLAARGGGRSSTLFQNPDTANAQTQGLFNSARSNAASNLAQIGAQQGQLGVSNSQVSGGVLNAQQQALAQQQAHQNQVGQQLGSGLFNIAKGVNWAGLGGGGGGGGGVFDGGIP